MGSNIDSQNRLANGAILIISTILKHVMSLAEADIGSVFLNEKEATILKRTTLKEIEHPQSPTPLKTDNTTATEYIIDTEKQRSTHVMDVRFYWIKGRVKQGQFHAYTHTSERPTNRSGISRFHIARVC
jgi:hypothetical protein